MPLRQLCETRASEEDSGVEVGVVYACVVHCCTCRDNTGENSSFANSLAI